jgi:hypothetical protein
LLALHGAVGVSERLFELADLQVYVRDAAENVAAVGRNDEGLAQQFERFLPSSDVYQGLRAVYQGGDVLLFVFLERHTA